MIYLIKSAEAANRSLMGRLLRDSGVTTVQYLTPNGVLKEHEALTQVALARRVFVRPQSMQNILRNLEINELIKRKSHAGDCRQRVILITANGTALMRSLEPRIATFDAGLCSDLTEQEETVLRDVLRRVRLNAESYEEQSEL